MTLNIDLNLLHVLHVLLEERSVTRTGERLGRTQSAISNALKRLRDRLGDPLLLRTPEGLTPTPRAEQLAPLVARIVEDAMACAAPTGTFDPATAEEQFRIGAPDRLGIPIVLPLLESVGRKAPGIVLNLRTTDRDYALRLIESGEIDLAVGWFDRTPPHVASMLAYEDRFVCLCRKDHPLLDKTPPTLDNILSHAHLVVSSTGDQSAAFDAILHRHGRRRSIGATLMSFTIVPELLERSDLVGVFTHRVADYLASRYEVAAVPVPLEVSPIANRLIWHRRFDSDRAHAWLRGEVLLASRRIMPGAGRG